MTQTFDITPNTAVLARVFAESIQQANEKIDRVEALTELLECGQHRDLQPGEEDRGDILEGLYLVINQEHNRIASLQSALDECVRVENAKKEANE